MVSLAWHTTPHHSSTPRRDRESLSLLVVLRSSVALDEVSTASSRVSCSSSAPCFDLSPPSSALSRRALLSSALTPSTIPPYLPLLSHPHTLHASPHEPPLPLLPSSHALRHLHHRVRLARQLSRPWSPAHLPPVLFPVLCRSPPSPRRRPLPARRRPPPSRSPAARPPHPPPPLPPRPPRPPPPPPPPAVSTASTRTCSSSSRATMASAARCRPSATCPASSSGRATSASSVSAPF